MRGFLPSHMTPWALWGMRVQTASVLCAIAYAVIPCPIWGSSPSLPSLWTLGFQLSLSDFCVNTWVKPWLLDSLPSSPQGCRTWRARHTQVPLQLRKSFFVLLYSWGVVWEAAKGPLYPEGTDVCILSLTADFSSLLSSIPGKLFSTEERWFSLAKLSQTFG